MFQEGIQLCSKQNKAKFHEQKSLEWRLVVNCLKEKMKVAYLRNKLLPFSIVPNLLFHRHQKSNLVKILTQFNSWVMALSQPYKNFQITLALSWAPHCLAVSMAPHKLGPASAECFSLCYAQWASKSLTVQNEGNQLSVLSFK